MAKGPKVITIKSGLSDEALQMLKEAASKPTSIVQVVDEPHRGPWWHLRMFFLELLRSLVGDWDKSIEPIAPEGKPDAAWEFIFPCSVCRADVCAVVSPEGPEVVAEWVDAPCPACGRAHRAALGLDYYHQESGLGFERIVTRIPRYHLVVEARSVAEAEAEWARMREMPRDPSLRH